jgi:transposase
MSVKPLSACSIGGWFAGMINKYKDNPEEFMKHYHQRSNAETTFSMVKATTGEPVWAKTQ